MAEDRVEDSPAGSSMDDAKTPDLLYGWLVGRAAADLGLAQALAASDAQRLQQMKRLEESLLAQIRGVQESQAVTFGSIAVGTDIEQIKAEVSKFLERQNNLEAQQVNVSQFEAQLKAKIGELEQEIQQRPSAISSSEIDNLQCQLNILVERMSRVESAAAQGPTTADLAAERQQIAETVRAHGELLKSELAGQLRDQQAASSCALDNLVQKWVDELKQEMREKAAQFRLRDGELSDVRMQLAALGNRLDAMAATLTPVPSAEERASEHARWEREADERLTIRLRELGDEVRGKLQAVGGLKVDRALFDTQTGALAARLSQLEQFVQDYDSSAADPARRALETASALRGEIAGLKAELAEQRQSGQPVEAVMRGVEENLRHQMTQMHDRLTQDQSNARQRESQINDLAIDIRALAQRLVQVENTAQQAHASVAHESTQIRSAVKAELAVLESQLHERRSRDAAVPGLAAGIDQKLGDLQEQLARRNSVIERRDSQFRELKTQVDSLVQRLAGIGAPPESAQSGVANFMAGSLARPLPTQSPLGAAMSESGSLLPSADPGSGLSADKGKERAANLHEQMAADIERARAELREKSGRWKAR